MLVAEKKEVSMRHPFILYKDLWSSYGVTSLEVDIISLGTTAEEAIEGLVFALEDSILEGEYTPPQEGHQWGYTPLEERDGGVVLFTDSSPWEIFRASWCAAAISLKEQVREGLFALSRLLRGDDFF